MKTIIAVWIFIASVLGAAVTFVEERLHYNSTGKILEFQIDKHVDEAPNVDINEEQTGNKDKGQYDETTDINEYLSRVTEKGINYEINDETTTENMTYQMELLAGIPTYDVLSSALG